MIREVNESQSINLFDPDEKIFNDICEPFSYNGTDINMYLRIHYFYQNQSLCQENCYYNGIKFDELKVVCICPHDYITIEKFRNEREMKTSQLINNNPNIDKYNNIKILKCHKVFFKYPANFGFIIYILISAASIFSIILFYLKNYNPKKYKEELLKYTNVEIFGSYIDWYILFNDIKIGNYSINIRKVLLSLNFGLIKGTKQLEEILINNYFKGKKYEKRKENIYTYYCFDYKSIIDNFPSINFYIKEFNETFILTKEDLFTEYNKMYYLNIFFLDYDENVPYWILGNIFLKKYQFIFNFERRTIGYYSRINNNSKNNFLIILFIIILIIILISLVYFYFKLTKKRKKRQNEINDIYEYISKD
jgi:hypothetical protein